MRLFAFFIVSFLWLQSPEAQAYQTLKKKIEQTYGIQIEFDNIEFPDNERWNGKVSASTVKKSKKLRKKLLKNLQTDLNKYDSLLIARFAKKIYIVERLKLFNKEIAGTFESEDGSLYLLGAYLGGVNRYATVFHHEFSSLLLYDYYSEGFYQKWTKLNPDGFIYHTDQNDSNTNLDGNGDLAGHPTFYKQGFVFGYGTSSFENDFNTFFELMMGDPVRLSKLESQYPIIRKKAELLRQFYYGTVLANIQLTSAN